MSECGLGGLDLHFAGIHAPLTPNYCVGCAVYTARLPNESQNSVMIFEKPWAFATRPLCRQILLFRSSSPTADDIISERRNP
jgi:hypothetical protein